MRILHRMWLPGVYFAILALAVMAPLLGRGYVLTLDMVFGPHILVPPMSAASFPFFWLLHMLATVVAVDILQKLLLLGIFFGAGYGMYRLYLTLDKSTPYRLFGALCAGTAYAVNPFVYSRFMAGQYMVLLGYALLPVAFGAWYRFMGRPSVRTAVVAGAVAWVLGCVSLHMLGVYGLLAAVYFVAQMIRLHRERSVQYVLLRWAGTVAVVWAITSIWWLAPALTGSAPAARTVADFSAADFQAFRTQGSGWGVLANIATLRGFWADAQDLYLLPQDVYSWWWVPVVLLAALAVYGWCVSAKAARSIALTIGSAALIAGALAAWPDGMYWLAAHVPGFAGYRDAHKFVAVIALASAYFVGYGAAVLVPRITDAWRLTASVLLALPLFTAPLLMGGAYGQLTPRQYPADWYQVNAFLVRHNGSAPVVLLPWHLYMPYDFAGRTIATPARAFFNAPVITSADPEFKSATGYATDETQRRVNAIITQSTVHVGTQLQTAGVRYVVLAKTFDYQSYGYLDHQQDMRPVMRTPSLVVYKTGEQ